MFYSVMLSVSPPWKWRLDSILFKVNFTRLTKGLSKPRVCVCVCVAGQRSCNILNYWMFKNAWLSCKIWCSILFIKPISSPILLYIVFSYSISRVFFHLGKYQNEEFSCVVETFAWMDNYPGVYSRQKQILHQCRAEQAVSSRGFGELCLTCDEGDWSETVIVDTVKH